MSEPDFANAAAMLLRELQRVDIRDGTGSLEHVAAEALKTYYEAGLRARSQPGTEPVWPIVEVLGGSEWLEYVVMQDGPKMPPRQFVNSIRAIDERAKAAIAMASMALANPALAMEEGVLATTTCKLVESLFKNFESRGWVAQMPSITVAVKRIHELIAADDDMPTGFTR